MALTGCQATGSSVSSSATAVTLLAANPRRRGYILWNDSAQTLYVKFGSGATSTDYAFSLGSGAGYESTTDTLYHGLISGVWASADGAARVTELWA